MHADKVKDKDEDKGARSLYFSKKNTLKAGLFCFKPECL